MAYKPMFPHTIDSTFLNAFHACPQKALKQYVEHWKSRDGNVNLIAGGAFAKGIETARLAFYSQGLSGPDAEGKGLIALISKYGDFECPEDSPKSLERMCGALEFYFERYPLGADGADPLTFASGRRAIEFSFAEPIAVAHPVTGDPILYTGRADMIAERAAGIYPYDEKTTTSLGASWTRKWEMRSQFTGYVWACHRQGIKAHGVIVRGISILKTKYDTLEVLTHRSQYELDRWYDQICRDIRRAITMWEAGYWDYNLDDACQDYGGCQFVGVCKSHEPEKWLPMSFVQRVWDPLLHKEVSVAEYEQSWGHVRAPGEPPAPTSTEVSEISDSEELQESFADLFSKKGV